jgi:hypothetical protein
MALLKELFKTLLEILGWHEVWDAYDWIRQSRWGKQVLTAIGALLVGAVGYASKHPALIWVAVGMLIGWLATRVVSCMLLRHRGDSIDDWYAFSFLLPTEATGLWLVGLTRDEPFLAFHFIIRNASNYPVEITSIEGTISAIDGPCNVPPWHQ